MVRSMAAEQKSLPIIVNAVHRVYERHIRADALTETGNQGPEWSKKSIENHLLYSTEFRELFDSFVERYGAALAFIVYTANPLCSCLQNIIIRQVPILEVIRLLKALTTALRTHLSLMNSQAKL